MGSKENHKPRNYMLGGSGVMRFSRSRMYAKRAIYKKKKPGQKKVAPPKAAAVMITKQIGGDKNGGTRTVRINRLPKSYPTEEKQKKLKSRKNTFSQHKRSLRSSITPGTVLLLLAGRHKGKRVVFLKQLATGLLLVTGPFKLNACPLRRINQIYVIATKTKIDISGINMPDHLNDEYFKRIKAKKQKQGEGEIFDTKKEEYKVTDQRKEDQSNIDKQLFEAMKKRDDRKFLIGYLGAMFSLKNGQYPHKMNF